MVAAITSRTAAPKTQGPKSPTFSGQAMINGQLMSVSIWHNPPGTNKQTGAPTQENFSLTIKPWEDRPPQGQGQQPQQQTFGYGAPPHQTMPHPPQPQHAPHPQGYAPQPPQQGYQRAPQAGPPPQYQPPQNGAYGAPAGRPSDT